MTREDGHDEERCEGIEMCNLRLICTSRCTEGAEEVSKLSDEAVE